MELIQLPNVAIDILVALLGSRVLALDLDGADQLKALGPGFSGNEVHAFVAVREIHIPARISD
jgi:hypothetical protein